MHSRHLSAATLAAVALSISIAQAEEQGTAALDPVVITATRTEQPADQSLASVSIITASDIERLQANNIMDVLGGQAGIAIANSGGEGKLTTLFMRGTSSNHVLVLINGMRFGSTTAGLAALQDIPIDQVERIEIVRGPRASLYGSDAIGGVIQVFTRNAEVGLQMNADVTAGSFGRREAGFGAGERFDKAWYRVDVSQVTLDGFDACENDTSSGCFADEPDDDGYDNSSISGRIGYAFSDATEIELDAWRAEGETEFDGFFNRTDYQRGALNLRATTSLTDDWSLGFRGGRSTDDAENSGAFASSYTDTYRDEYTLQSDLAFDGGLVTFGADLRKDAVESSTDYDETSRDTTAGFVQLQLDGDDWHAETALRYTDDDQFGSRDTGSVALGYDFSPNWSGWLSHGSAFHAPTFNDLYYPGFSNPDLRPETSHATELGIRRSSGSQRLDINIYRNRLGNLIEFDFAAMMPVNVSSALIRGLEISWQARMDDWTLSTSATFLDAENQSASNAGNELPRRPGRSLRIDIDRTIGDWTVGTGLLAESSRYDDLGNNTELPGYATLDLRASWNINASWELATRIGNLLDRDYQTVAGYHQAGRNAQLTLRYRY